MKGAKVVDVGFTIGEKGFEKWESLRDEETDWDGKQRFQMRMPDAAVF